MISGVRRPARVPCARINDLSSHPYAGVAASKKMFEPCNSIGNRSGVILAVERSTDPMALAGRWAVTTGRRLVLGRSVDRLCFENKPRVKPSVAASLAGVKACSVTRCRRILVDSRKTIEEFDPGSA